MRLNVTLYLVHTLPDLLELYASAYRINHKLCVLAPRYWRHDVDQPLK
jgi:hypothetical protein